MRVRHPADLVWLVILGIGLGADLPLIRAGHQSVSERAGATFARRLVVLYLACHFLRQPAFLRRVDPLSLIARRIRP